VLEIGNEKGSPFSGSARRPGLHSADSVSCEASNLIRSCPWREVVSVRTRTKWRRSYGRSGKGKENKLPKSNLLDALSCVRHRSAMHRVIADKELRTLAFPFVTGGCLNKFGPVSSSSLLSSSPALSTSSASLVGSAISFCLPFPLKVQRISLQAEDAVLVMMGGAVGGVTGNAVRDVNLGVGPAENHFSTMASIERESYEWRGA
jgi:hypothetical protein